MSARKRYANRINARSSTGPRTSGGKVRAARNARRHGLGALRLRDPDVAGEVDALARAIAGTNADAQLIAWAWPVAVTHVDLRRASTARHEILLDPSRESTAAFAAIAAIERYEAQARKHRKSAIAAFEAARRQAQNSLNETRFYETKPKSKNVERAGCYV